MEGIWERNKREIIPYVITKVIWDVCIAKEAGLVYGRPTLARLNPEFGEVPRLEHPRMKNDIVV